MKQKVLSLAAILVLAVLTTSAQKNSKFVTGTASYSKSTDVKASYNITPTIGYYVTDKVSVGVLGSLGETATTKTSEIGFFGRCDFLTVGKNCQVFSQLGLSSNSVTEAGDKVSATVVNLGLGANYFLTKKLALTMNVTDLVSYVSSDGVSTTTIGFNGVANPFAVAKFGIFYKF